MLLNLSNHPSSKWFDSQLSTAQEEFGAVEDMTFPTIPPEWSSDEVEQLAEEYEIKIRKLNPVVVHIMGEMTFVFKLVQRLKAIGIPCIASTTSREVIENNDGTKTSTFKFVAFRSY